MKNCLFELSWEVCNKVGGIHTVIASKIFEAQSHFSSYFCIGPYKSQTSDVFDEQTPPEWMIQPIEDLKKRGIEVHYGVWNVEGFPEVLLIDYMGFSSSINECKKELWEQWEVDSLGTQWYDFDEVFLWAWTSGVVVERFSEEFSQKSIIHAHEWMSGGSIAYLYSRNSSIATVFTTHATILGRTMFSNGISFDEFKSTSPLEFSEQLGVKTKHQLEKSCAVYSDCFTTVSSITSDEAELVYGKKPNYITYNGFDSHNSDLYVLEKQFIHSRNQVNDFLMKYFYDFFNYDINETCLMYFSGRYEFKNKGMDIIVEALSEINERLKQDNSNRKVIFWFMLLLGKFPYDDKAKESIEHATSGDVPQHLGYAPLSPYKLPLENELVQMLVSKQLVNNENDPVKVIITPQEFNGNDGLINIDYYKLISGFDLGVFPSLYEPWGYTPAESLSYGVPAVSSDMTGIGREACSFGCDESFKVIERENKSYEEEVSSLVDVLWDKLEFSSKEQIKRKIQAKICSQKFSWKVFYSHYLKAYNYAIENK